MKPHVLMSFALLMSTPAIADITTKNASGQNIAYVLMTQGRFDDCSANGEIFKGQMAQDYSEPWPNTGGKGDSICWLRSRDLNNANSGVTTWTICYTDGDCDIQ